MEDNKKIMKKEYFIIGLIIVALSAYLVTNKTNRDNYTLPSIPEIDVANITEISLQKGENEKDAKHKDGKIVISKKDGAWLVTGAAGDKNYPADQESITKMVDIIKALKLSALVSESGNLAPYELDAKNRIGVTVKSSTETLRKFEIGKTAPSFRHTFVKLDGSNSVYHAEKSFRQDFGKTVDELRDRKVLTFDKNKISSITLKKGDKVQEFAIKDGKPVETIEKKPVDKKDDKTVQNKPKPADNNRNEAVEKIISTLSDLKCSGFTDTDSKDEFKGKGIEEIARITLKGNNEKSLVIYKKDAKENYPALSSGTIYPFMLDTYQGNELVSGIDNAMGIKTESKAPESK